MTKRERYQPTMNAIALIAIYAVPVLFAYACHEAGHRKGAN